MHMVAVLAGFSTNGYRNYPCLCRGFISGTVDSFSQEWHSLVREPWPLNEWVWLRSWTWLTCWLPFPMLAASRSGCYWWWLWCSLYPDPPPKKKGGSGQRLKLHLCFLFLKNYEHNMGQEWQTCKVLCQWAFFRKTTVYSVHILRETSSQAPTLPWVHSI